MVRPLTPVPANAPRVGWREGVESRLHGAGASSLCVLEQWSAPGAGAPTHHHPDVEELVLIVAGSAEFWIDGAVELLDEGMSIVVPAESVHGFRNVGSTELHTIATFPSAHATVEYECEPGRVLEIADRHRRAGDAP